MAARVAVLIETGRTKSFASALDWPGWSRSGREPDAVLAELEAYRERYDRVLGACGLDAPTGTLVVVEACPGDATTDFGAPSAIGELDLRALRRPTSGHVAAILQGCWRYLDDVAARTTAPLRKGPRGGGRDVGVMLRHVADAEVAYARAMGLRVSATNGDGADVAALRARMCGVVTGEVRPDREGKWPVRYAARRIAWHACDHAFEIEDRSA